MRQHLTTEAINGYIHHTLTDAQRESIDRHLLNCDTCRTSLEAAQRLQRHLRYGLRDALRRERAPATMHYQALAPDLRRERFWAAFRFRTRQALTTAGGLALVVLLVLFIRRNVSGPALDSVEEAAVTWLEPTYFAPAVNANSRSAAAAMNAAPVYDIDLTVLLPENRVDGRQRLFVTNASADPWPVLYLRLPANVYGENLTVGALSVDNRPVAIQTELSNTLVRLPLQPALAPGARLIIDLEFSLSLRDSPFTFNGTLGQIKDVLTLSYFHPVLAAYSAGEWDLEQPVHGIGGVGEAAFYQVRVTAPAALVLAASGVQAGPVTQAGDLQTVTFLAGPADHFYLTGSAQAAPILTEQVGATRVNVYVLGDLPAGKGPSMLATAVRALTLYQALFGDYPYPELDMIATPTLSFPRPVVTYPGVVLISGHTYKVGGAELERAVVHGVANQWFGPAAGNQIGKEPWLADSLSEHALRYYMLETYADDALYQFGRVNELLEIWKKRANAVSGRYSVGQPVDAYPPGDYYKLIFGRGPLFLDDLAATMGRDAYTAFLADFVVTYRWRTATGADFQALAATYCECELEPLWARWIYAK